GDDLQMRRVEPQRPTEDVRVAAKTLHPETVAEDDHAVGAGFMLFGREYSPQGRLNAQRREEVSRGGEAPQPLGRLSRLGQIRADPIIGDHLVEDRVLLAELEEVPR